MLWLFFCQNIFIFFFFFFFSYWKKAIMPPWYVIRIDTRSRTELTGMVEGINFYCANPHTILLNYFLIQSYSAHFPTSNWFLFCSLILSQYSFELSVYSAKIGDIVRSPRLLTAHSCKNIFANTKFILLQFQWNYHSIIHNLNYRIVSNVLACRLWLQPLCLVGKSIPITLVLDSFFIKMSCLILFFLGPWKWTESQLTIKKKAKRFGRTWGETSCCPRKTGWLWCRQFGQGGTDSI